MKKYLGLIFIALFVSLYIVGLASLSKAQPKPSTFYSVLVRDFLNATGTIHATDTITTSSDVSAVGDVIAGNNLRATGSLVVDGPADIAGAITSSGELEVGTTTIHGPLTATGRIETDSDLGIKTGKKFYLNVSTDTVWIENDGTNTKIEGANVVINGPGTTAILSGDDTTGDDLTLRANSIDAYSYITLTGNGHLFYHVPVGYSHEFNAGGVRYAYFNSTDFVISNLGNGVYDAMLYLNGAYGTVDEENYLEIAATSLTTGNAIRIDVDNSLTSGRGISYASAGTELFAVMGYGDVFASGTYYGDGSGLTGVLISTPTFQAVTEAGATTTLLVQAAGLLSEGDVLPLTDNIYDLGASGVAWATGHINTLIVASTTIYFGDPTDGILISRSGSALNLTAEEINMSAAGTSTFQVVEIGDLFASGTATFATVTVSGTINDSSMPVATGTLSLNTGTPSDSFVVDNNDDSGFGGGVIYGGVAPGQSLILASAESAFPAATSGAIQVSDTNVAQFITVTGEAQAVMSLNHDGTIKSNNNFQVRLWDVDGATITDAFIVYADGIMGLGAPGTFAKIDKSNLTGDRVFTLSDQTGTVALTSDFSAGLAATLATSTVTGTFDVYGNISPTDDELGVWTSGPATKTIAINSNFQGRGAIIGYDIASSTSKTFILSAGNSDVEEEHAYLCLGDTCSDTGMGIHLNGNAGISAWVASPDNVVVEISADDRPSIDVKAGINVKNPVSEDLMFLVDADNGNIAASGTITVGGDISTDSDLFADGNATASYFAADNAAATSTFDGNVEISGNLVGGSSPLKLFTDIDVTGNIIPTETGVYDLGSSSNRINRIWLDEDSLELGDISLIDRGDCLATTDFTALGQGGGIAGKIKLATGTAPIAHTESGFVQLYPKYEKLYLMESDGTEREMVTLTATDSLQINGSIYASSSLEVDGVVDFNSALTMNDNQIHLVATPTLITDAANKGYADSVIGVIVAEATESVGISSTTSNTVWQEKLAATVTVSATTTFHVSFAVEITCTDVNRDFMYRVRYDDTEELMITTEGTTVGDAYRQRSGFVVKSVPPGTHRFDFDFKLHTAGATVSIRRAHMLLRKQISIDY